MDLLLITVGTRSTTYYTGSTTCVNRFKTQDDENQVVSTPLVLHEDNPRYSYATLQLR